MGSSDEIDLDAKTPPVATSAIEGGAGVEASEAAAKTSLDASRAIADGLASGALDPVAAQQLLIDQVLSEQFPGIAPAQLEQIRGELADLLADDPTLAGLLRP